LLGRVLERIVALHKEVGNIQQGEPVFGCNILKDELDVINSLSRRHTFRNQDLIISASSWWHK